MGTGRRESLGTKTKDLLNALRASTHTSHKSQSGSLHCSKCLQSSFYFHSISMCRKSVDYSVGFKWAVLWLGGKCQGFSAGNLRHKNVTAGYRVNQYGSQGRGLKVGGKERGMLPQVKHRMTTAEGREAGEHEEDREKRILREVVSWFREELTSLPVWPLTLGEQINLWHYQHV